jgi:hypothetical protein
MKLEYLLTLEACRYNDYLGVLSTSKQ